eukprot:309403-Chlamydomonas_euryale.AAC.2
MASCGKRSLASGVRGGARGGKGVGHGRNDLEMASAAAAKVGGVDGRSSGGMCSNGCSRGS